MKMRAAGKDAKLIVSDEGNQIGQALRLANDRWAPFDMNEKRLVECGVSFKSPAATLRFFQMAHDELKGRSK